SHSHFGRPDQAPNCQLRRDRRDRRRCRRWRGLLAARIFNLEIWGDVAVMESVKFLGLTDLGSFKICAFSEKFRARDAVRWVAVSCKSLRGRPSHLTSIGVSQMGRRTQRGAQPEA
ncbi:hypothetical protein CTA1_806, partial [Colletotrichum tanaceti]